MSQLYAIASTIVQRVRSSPILNTKRENPTEKTGTNPVEAAESARRWFLWLTLPAIALSFGFALVLFWSVFIGPSPTVVYDLRRDRFTLVSHDAWSASTIVDPALTTTSSPCISPYAHACGNWSRDGDYLWDNMHHVFRRVAIESVASLKWAPDAIDTPFSDTYKQCIREILSPSNLREKQQETDLLSVMTIVDRANVVIFDALVALGEHALFPILDWHIDNDTMTVHPSLWIDEFPERSIRAACRWLRAVKHDPTHALASCEDTVTRKHSILMQLREKKIAEPVPFPLALFSTLTHNAFDDLLKTNASSDGRGTFNIRVFSASKIQWLAKMFEKPDPAWTLWLRVAVLLDISQYSTALMRFYDDAAIDTPYYSLLTPDPLENVAREYPPWVHGWGPHALTSGVARDKTTAARARSSAEESCRWLLQELAPGVVGKYMRPSNDALVLARRLFDDIRAVITKDVDRANGLSPEWKESAKNRLSTMRLAIGFPYEGTPVINQNDALWKSALAWRAFHHVRDPAFRADWPGDYHPETIDASYSVRTNTVYLPFALLHAPFLDPNAPTETHYARLGFTLAHEIAHGLTPKVMLAVSNSQKDYMIQRSFTACFPKNYPTYVREDEDGNSESLADAMGIHWTWAACLDRHACAKRDAMRAFANVFSQSFCTTRSPNAPDAHAAPIARVNLALSSAYDLAGRNLMQQAWGCDAAPKCSMFKR